MKNVRSWKLLLPLAALVAVASVWASGSFAAAQSHTIRVAIMTDCKGAFAFGYELDIGGAQAAFAQYAGGKVKNKNKPSAGMTGIKVGGHNVQIVGYGCGDDTGPTALKETRRLMEQLKADVMIGPLSGDEAVSVANYAKSHPTKTFIIGTAGSQDPTLQIAPKNVFRYHGDGAQWNAGLGEILYKKLGWRKAAIVMDDYSFGWTSGAGIIADFCGIGGQITKRVFPPLNTTDYAPFVRQLPRPGTVDGYIWVVGGTGTASSLKAFEQAYGRINPRQHAGNLFFAFLGADKVVGPKVVGTYVGGFGTGPGLKTVRSRAYEAIMRKWYPKLPAADGFVYNYYNAAWALVRALQANNGQVGAALQSAMPKTQPVGLRDLRRRSREARLPPPGDPGPVPPAGRQERGRLDRHQDRRLRAERRSVVRRSVQAVEPGSGSLAAGVREEEAAVAGQDPRGAERHRHEQDHQVAMTEAPTVVPNAAPTLRLRGVGRRFGGLLAVSDVDLDVAHGERRAILGPNGAGKTTLFNVISGDLAASSGSVELFGEDVTTLPPRKRTKRGLARTYQQSRMLLGVSVEDSIYLSALGVGAGHLRPVTLPRRDQDLRERARAAAKRAAIDHKLSELVGSLSHGEHRQVAIAMALASEPRLLMLDEPASGLSRGERQLLTELLLGLDRDITLVLIEHDMDVALTVAERVTMMHNGQRHRRGHSGRDPGQHARPRSLPGPASRGA